MHLSPSDRFKKYLRKKNITPRVFSRISGMPLREVQGILKGELPVTILRANHLAAVFDTDTDVWLNGDHSQSQKYHPEAESEPVE